LESPAEEKNHQYNGRYQLKKRIEGSLEDHKATLQWFEIPKVPKVRQGLHQAHHPQDWCEDDADDWQDEPSTKSNRPTNGLHRCSITTDQVGH
jgi:hypothetical protein